MPRKAKAIFCADLHIRETQPECRTDDFWTAQQDKMLQLSELQQKHNCPILCAGDLFHHWKPSPFLITWCIKCLPKNIIVVPGNHDLPNHSMELLGKSGLQTLHEAGIVEIIPDKLTNVMRINDDEDLVFAFPWGVEPKNPEDEGSEFTIALIHRLVSSDKDNLWFHADASSATSFIKKLSGYDIIVTGDNHQSFVAKYKDTLLINPGCFTRQTATMEDHEPSVSLWYGDHHVERKILQYDKNVISRKHLDHVKERDERMEKFIDQLNDNYKLDLSYEKNLESYFEKNSEHQQIQEMVWESLEQ
jgi:predicted phosphodiesterase